MRHAWLKIFPHFRDLEVNRQTQLKVHIWGQVFWIINVPLFIWSYFVYPKEFVAMGILITGLYSLYANWATDNGAAAAISAELNTSPSNEVILAAVENSTSNTVSF